MTLPPPRVQAAVAGLGDLMSMRCTSARRGLETWTDGVVLLDLATDDDGRRRLRTELAGRAWAAQVGVRTPELLASRPDGEWVLSRRAEPAESLTAPQLAQAVEAALRMEDGVRTVTAEATSWSAPRRTLVRRVSRVVRERVPLRAFRAARAAAAQLPDDGMAHGDLHSGNLFSDDRGLLVADWEYLAPAPRGTDVMRLWSTCLSAQERADVLERALSGADRARRARLGVLGRWLALRSLAEAAVGEESTSRTQALAVARAVVRESGDLPDG